MTSRDEILENSLKDLIKTLGDDPEREGMRGTPRRALLALRHLTQGYRRSLKDIVNDAIFETNVNQIVIIKDIELYSLCQHHLLPFIGKCHVGYLPNGKVIGLSKVARIVDLFAQRFQLQESLTKQVAECIMSITEASGVGVVIEAQHLCMMMRGVEKQNSVMKTSAMLGKFCEDHKTRLEFLHLLQH